MLWEHRKSVSFFVSVLYLHSVWLTLTVMSVFWLICLWTGFAWTVCTESISISISLPLSACSHSLFVCVLYTGKDVLLWWRKYLFGWMFTRKKKGNEHLMKEKWVFQPCDPCVYEVCSRNVPRTFPHQKSSKFMYNRVSPCVFDCVLIGCSHFLCVLGMLWEHKSFVSFWIVCAFDECFLFLLYLCLMNI